MRLFVTDIDNTLFDWVTYYVEAFTALLNQVSSTTGVPYETLAEQAKEVFEHYGSIEYPFLVQELPAVIDHYQERVDDLLRDAVEPARKVFLEHAEANLQPYPGVPETMAKVRENYPGVPIVALTDAPRYVAMWKLNKLGLLPYFDAVYGLPDPRLPTDPNLGRVKVHPHILLKHLEQSNFGYDGKIRILPDDYEKPGTKGLKTVLMDYEMDEDPAVRHSVIWVGDNLRKDVGLGRQLGVQTAWASYGAKLPKELMERLQQFSPPQNVHKNASLPIDGAETPQPDVTLEKFADILDYLKG